MTALGTAAALLSPENGYFGRCHHGKTPGERCAVGTDRNPLTAPQTAPPALPWPQALGFPPRPHGDYLRPENRDQLGGLAGRTGLGLWQDLQTLPQGLAAVRRLAAVAPAPAGGTSGRRADRLVPRGRRQYQ